MNSDSQGKIVNQDFIVFGEDFGRHAHSLEHLLRPLFADNRFIWVETIGIRSPKLNLYDLARIFEKLKSWIGRGKTRDSKIDLPARVSVVSPVMIPFNQFSIVRKFNAWSVKRTVQRELLRLQFVNPAIVTSVPNACDYVKLFGQIPVFYVCVDEFSLWPGLNYSLVKKMEDGLLLSSDLVFATSQALQESKSNGKTATLLLTHGVDFAHFNIGTKNEMGSPLKLCYFGLFDERNDQSIIEELAKSLPDAEVHIFGKVVTPTPKLKSISSVVFHGPVTYQELPAVIADMDIFILAYVQNELTRNINPLKLKEYLSTGRPVISTPLPEVVKLKEYLFLADSGSEFAQIAQDLRDGNLQYNSKMVTDYICLNEVWSSKSKLFSFEVFKTIRQHYARTSFSGHR